MIGSSSSLPRASSPSADPAPSSAEDGSALGAYGWPFWLAYVNNLCLMTAIAMLYRYADLVTVLGGSEWELGWILGVGMVGSLVMRLAQGVGIDHYGPRLVWIGSTAAFAVVCWSHLALTTTHGPAIYVLRIAFCTAVAGVFGCANTFISSRVPVARVAEVVGTLGTSGFIGMILGANLADWLCGDTPPWAASRLSAVLPESMLDWLVRPHAVPERGDVDRIFLVAGALGVMAMIFSALATHGAKPPPKHEHPPLGHLLRRYHPGMLILVALAVGIGTGVPINYLRPFTEELGLPGIGLFFSVYAPAAFAIRLMTRGWAQRYGIRPMVCLGLATLAVSMCLFLVVRSQSEWLLAIPAVTAGMAHAFLFPSVVGGGSTSFPPRYRGLGMTVMMSLTDLGNLIGAPLCALILRGAHFIEWPAYPTLFVAMAVLVGSVCALYVAIGKNHRPGGEAALEMRSINPASELG
jgi:MFS family permease